MSQSTSRVGRRSRGLAKDMGQGGVVGDDGETATEEVVARLIDGNIHG